MAGPFASFRFQVVLTVPNASAYGLATPLCSAAFAECSGLEATMEPKTLREGGNNYEEIHLAGPVSYGQLTLKRGMTESFDLWKWFGLVTTQGKTAVRATGEVRILGPDGEPQASFRVRDCLPIRLRAPSLNARETGLALEELTLAYGRFELVT